MEDHSQAISFANNYFSLIDGLVPAVNLDNYLAEDVVLDWYGKIIRGKNNVAEFMNARKLTISSRHVFNSITPINYNIDYCNKSERNCSSKTDELRKVENHEATCSLPESEELNFENLSINDFASGPENNNIVKGVDVLKNDSLNQLRRVEEEIEMKMGIKSTIDEHKLKEIDDERTNINDIMNNKIINKKKKKNDERSTLLQSKKLLFANQFFSHSNDDRDCDLLEEKSSSSSSTILNNSDSNYNSEIKYVEAIGQIEFSKKSNKRGINGSVINLQNWKRQSKLQIAYSLIKNTNNGSLMNNTFTNDIFKDDNKKGEATVAAVKSNYDNHREEITIEMETEENNITILPSSASAINNNLDNNEKILPTLEEITSIGNKLVPNVNNFDGYLDFDFTTDRDEFLTNFHSQLLTVKNNSTTTVAPINFLLNQTPSPSSPHCVKDRSIFPKIINNCSNYNNISKICNCSLCLSETTEKFKKIIKHEDKIINNKLLYDNNYTRRSVKNIHANTTAAASGFVFNYLIHIVIYQGNAKCRRSLTKEFDFQNKNDNNNNDESK